MQKKIIALAIAGLASTAAFAQSNVTIYGSVDVGFAGRSGDNGGLDTVHGRGEMTSGGSAGNRLGFKGTEDLGNGLKAIFEIEYGFGIDETAAPSKLTDSNGDTVSTKPGASATWTNRHSYVGLTGNFGTVVAGRLDGVRYGVYGTYDPFANGSIGNFTQMTVQYDRANNAIAYISPNYSGFGLVLAYATNTQAAEGSNAFGNGLGNNADDQLFTIMGTYDNGPISARLDYETTTLKSNGNNNRLYVATAGLSYDFGVVKVSGVYDIVKGDVNSFLGHNGAGVDTANILAAAAPASGKYDRQNYFIAASVPLGKFTLMGNVGRVNNKEVSNADATKFALGARYALSKRTYVYTAVSHIKNDDNATFQISQAANSNGAGLGVTGYELGLRHQF